MNARVQIEVLTETGGFSFPCRKWIKHSNDSGDTACSLLADTARLIEYDVVITTRDQEQQGILGPGEYAKTQCVGIVSANATVERIRANISKKPASISRSILLHALAMPVCKQLVDCDLSGV